MPSGAGHDAQILAQRLPAAMMFVPSIGGISHHFTENTEDADIVLGCQVFADAAQDPEGQLGGTRRRADGAGGGSDVGATAAALVGSEVDETYRQQLVGLAAAAVN